MLLLQLAEFHIYTDHQSLAQLNEQHLHTVWQQKGLREVGRAPVQNLVLTWTRQVSSLSGPAATCIPVYANMGPGNSGRIPAGSSRPNIANSTRYPSN
jgi:hypothetical protein